MEHTRTVTWDDGAELGALARESSGLEYQRRILAGGIRVPVWTTLGIRLVEVAEGTAVFEVEAGPWAVNSIGTVHGGWVAGVLDAPLGVCLQTLLPKGVSFTTVELKVNLTRPVRPERGLLRATGKVLHRGMRTAVTEARLEDAEGRLYAFATCTCMILEASAEARSEQEG